jgi:hypothetical protein
MNVFVPVEAVCLTLLLLLLLQDVLVNTTGQRYIVVDMLGAGTFGQVVSSYSEAEGRQVAVKVRPDRRLQGMQSKAMEGGVAKMHEQGGCLATTCEG